MYDTETHFMKVAELQAHTRCVTALAIDGKGSELATVSEDSYLHVWSLEPVGHAGEAKSGDGDAADDRALTLGYSALVADALLTGVQFVAAAPGAGKNADLAVTAYDVDAVSVWTRD